jgi:3',5'-nucleoside bisphosphate phosphatase
VIDLHLHTIASDGSLSPSILVHAAQAVGLTVISITDHDTIAGIAEGQAAAADYDVEVVPGIEISAVADGRDVHVLGYFIDTTSYGLREFLERQRADRIRRIVAMAERLEALGFPIDAEPVLASAGRGRSVGRPQIASALVAAGYVNSRDEAFRRFLEHGGPAFVPRRGASPEDVITIIHESGGVASMAHPGPSRCDGLIAPLAAAGLDAIEVRHPDHDQDTEMRYRTIARKLGLLVTGGSDYHGDTGHRVPSLGTVTLPADDFAALRAAHADR